nr:S8 family serine peptidase [Lactobacillus amylovorus]
FYVVKGKDGKLGVGSADQYTSDVKGKIAIVKRGDLTFTDKQKFAEKAGAAGLIIINNQAGPLTSVQYDAGFPTAGLSDTAGAALVKYVEEHPNEALKVNIEVQPLANTTTKSDLMSSFTSYGPVSNLAFKPDISAPGGNIWSTQNNNGYTNMSGTSMASPFIAGTQALVKQAMSDKKGTFYNLYQK